MNNKEFEKLQNEQWMSMKALLDIEMPTQKRKNRLFFFLWGAFLMVAFMTLLFYFNSNIDSQTIDENRIPQNDSLQMAVTSKSDSLTTDVALSTYNEIGIKASEDNSFFAEPTRKSLSIDVNNRNIVYSLSSINKEQSTSTEFLSPKNELSTTYTPIENHINEKLSMMESNEEENDDFLIESSQVEILPLPRLKVEFINFLTINNLPTPQVDISKINKILVHLDLGLMSHTYSNVQNYYGGLRLSYNPNSWTFYSSLHYRHFNQLNHFNANEARLINVFKDSRNSLTTSQDLFSESNTFEKISNNARIGYLDINIGVSKRIWKKFFWENQIGYWYLISQKFNKVNIRNEINAQSLIEYSSIESQLNTFAETHIFNIQSGINYGLSSRINLSVKGNMFLNVNSDREWIHSIKEYPIGLDLGIQYKLF